MTPQDDRTTEQWHGLLERWIGQYALATQRAYRDAIGAWKKCTQHPLWLVTPADVVSWIEEMRAGGLSAATINQRLGAVSSFYSFAIRDRQPDGDGVEVCLFVDARGNPRTNPFRSTSVRRARGRRTRSTKPLSREHLKAMRDAINPETRTGARDLALFECFVRTGRRLSEIARMRWCDIDPDTGQFHWSGKGGQDGEQMLPPSALNAIVAYLRLDGRWPVTDSGMYVFQPLATHGTANISTSAGQGHVSPGQIGRVIKKLAKRAGLDPDQVHAHLIRHSYAYYLYGATKDPRLVQEQLGHKRLQTTEVYLEGLGTPEDNVSAPLAAALGF